MGIIISRFRHKQSTKEQLQSIEKDIKSIHEFRIHTEQRQKRFVGALIAYSVVIYIIASLMLYFYYFPVELSQQILCTLPFLLFPVLVWFLKEFIRWFFQSKLRKNETRLTDLLRKKRKILDEVMETETYLVARELLEKYDPDQLRKKSGISKEDVLSQVAEPAIRRRSVGLIPGKPSPNEKLPMAPRNVSPGPPPGMFYPGTSGAPPMGRNTQFALPGSRPPGPPMPRPILPRERNYMERLIEYLVGDGPNTRYALICRQCQSHNGMALKEEFEYMAYRCCYCYNWNPARKQRPAAPRLPDQQFSPAPSVESLDKQSKMDDALNSRSSAGSESSRSTDDENDDLEDSARGSPPKSQEASPSLEAKKEESPTKDELSASVGDSAQVGAVDVSGDGSKAQKKEGDC